METVRTVRFVALGDSLTVGFVPEAFPSSYPYTDFLKGMIDEALKQREKNDLIRVEIVNAGVNGELTGDMLLRFRRDVINPRPDYAIILGGSNDIGWRVPIEETFHNLERMIQMAIDNRIRPVACTVPSILGWDEGIKPRLELNKLLKSFCSERSIPCADLFAATSDPRQQKLRVDYSSDGLHLNARGYEKMAETIFKEAVRDLLVREMNRTG